VWVKNGVACQRGVVFYGGKSNFGRGPKREEFETGDDKEEGSEIYFFRQTRGGGGGKSKRGGRER